MYIASTAGTEVCSRCRHARTAPARLRGLLGRPALEPGAGLLLEPCAGIHTLFLRRPIDVLFLDAGGAVMRVVEELQPWRFAACRGAHSVLELPPGTCVRLGIGPGDVLDAGGRDLPNGPAPLP